MTTIRSVVEKIFKERWTAEDIPNIQPDIDALIKALNSNARDEIDCCLADDDLTNKHLKNRLIGTEVKKNGK